MPNALRIGLLGPLQVRDETRRPVHVGGRQLRVLLTLLALDAGRVVPAGEIWRTVTRTDAAPCSRMRSALPPTGSSSRRWPT